MNETMVTIKVDEVLLEQMHFSYHDFMVDELGEYILFRAKKGQVVITAYHNTKGKANKVTFAGNGCLKEARRWDPNASAPQVITDDDEPLGWFAIDDQIGSDEVGTGDFFGPICVCAAYVKKEDVAYLKKLGVTDSKKLTDERILEMTPRLLRRFSYSQVSLGNAKYNELVKQGINMNEIKSRMHNRVLLNMSKKHRDVKHVYVDKFVSESRYFAYASVDNETKDNIVFKTKGESRFPSVALASVIARYSFITKMAALSAKYKMNIPFGASAKVDAFAQVFVNKHGVDELRKVAKCNFENYKRLKVD